MKKCPVADAGAEVMVCAPAVHAAAARPTVIEKQAMRQYTWFSLDIAVHLPECRRASEDTAFARCTARYGVRSLHRPCKDYSEINCIQEQTLSAFPLAVSIFIHRMFM